MIIYTCECCGFAKAFEDAQHAYDEGWDIPPWFTVVMTCDLCPSSGVMISRTEGKPPDHFHKKAHEHWREHGRPKDFDVDCGLDTDKKGPE
jgi:hypothetical protein